MWYQQFTVKKVTLYIDTIQLGLVTYQISYKLTYFSCRDENQLHSNKELLDEVDRGFVELRIQIWCIKGEHRLQQRNNTVYNIETTLSTTEKQYCLQQRNYTAYNRETTKFKTEKTTLFATEKLHCLRQKEHIVLLEASSRHYRQLNMLMLNQYFQQNISNSWKLKNNLKKR